MSATVGVGQEPDPITEVRGTNGRCRYAVPFCIIPERGQVAKNGAHPESKERWNVFHDDVAGSNQANDPGILPPEARAFAFEALLASGLADVLARESAANDVGGPGCRLKGSDVVVAGDAGPMPGEDLPRPRVDFALPDRVPDACSFEAKLKSADPAEEGADSEAIHA